MHNYDYVYLDPYLSVYALFSLVQHFNAGLLAGVLTTVVMTPGERIKCIMQVQYVCPHYVIAIVFTDTNGE